MQTYPEQLDLLTWPIFYRMSRRGLAVDLEKLHALKAELESKLDEQQCLIEYWSGQELNASSSQQVSDWMKKEGLFGKRKLSGNMDTSELALAKYNHPVIDGVLEVRGLTKLLNTFVNPIIEKAEKTGGTVHPKWRLTTVRSGRVATEDPNLLAFPSRDDMGLKVRSCFVARPGHKMISVDYSQLEPRIVAALSQDAKLLRVYSEGRDLYNEVAAEMGGIKRIVSKTLTLGILYGMMANTLHARLTAVGCHDYDVDGCEVLIAKWFEAFPGVVRCIGEIVAQARSDGGWVRTAGGRGRLLPALFLTGNGWPEEKLRMEAERQAFNHVIQGTGMEHLRHAMVVTDPVSTLLLAIHDELIFEEPAETANEIAATLSALMEQKFIGVTLKTNYVIGDNWGQLKG